MRLVLWEQILVRMKPWHRRKVCGCKLLPGSGRELFTDAGLEDHPGTGGPAEILPYEVSSTAEGSFLPSAQ